MNTTRTSTKRAKAPPLPTVKEAMQAAHEADEQRSQAARAEVLTTLRDTEQELEAVEDMLAACDAEVALLQEALDKAQARRQKDGQLVATLRARCHALTRTLDREHGNGMLQAAIGELIGQEQQLRAEADVLEAQRVPTRNRDGDRVLLQPVESADAIEALYIRMETFTTAANELNRLMREPITPTEIRSKIAEIYTGQGMPLAA